MVDDEKCPECTKRAYRLLGEVLDDLIIEVGVDPTTKATQKFAKSLADKMQKANDIMGFRK